MQPVGRACRARQRRAVKVELVQRGKAAKHGAGRVQPRELWVVAQVEHLEAGLQRRARAGRVQRRAAGRVEAGAAQLLLVVVW